MYILGIEECEVGYQVRFPKRKKEKENTKLTGGHPGRQGGMWKVDRGREKKAKEE